MKTAAVKNLKRKLAADEVVHGLWITLDSPSITEMAVALGLDWVVIDAEHGHLDWKEIVEHLRATLRSDTVALVRLAEHNCSLVKRALDSGADGVVIPWVETAEQLRRLVAFAHYPPRGVRGIGAERATGWGQCIPEHVAEASEHVLVVPMIESVRGGENIGEMLEVEGADLFLFGPADYSSSAGFAGQWQAPGVADQLLRIKDAIVKAGKCCGVVATSESNLIERRKQGFRILGLGSDCGFLLRGLHTMLATVDRDRKINTALTPGRAASESAPLDQPPESFRPDRPEVMNDFGGGIKIDIQPGVVFEALVGAHNRAKNLTTGVVRFAPAVKLAYHRHPTTESITLLEGAAIVDVEGRRYRLKRFDNVVIPAGVPHGVENASPEREALFHVTFPTDAPSREILEPIYPPRQMPDDSTGPCTPGLERVNRFATAEWFDYGQGATFIDFFNEELMPGIEMSGGYGLFQPGGRLPAHVHDFDESICIVEGTATCVVEGRRYSMGNYSTALQPRGRVHYFVNETSEPMAMIWVYAGPKPDRIVVDERSDARWITVEIREDRVSKFHVALTGDFYCANGEPKFADFGLSTFDGHPEISVRPFAEHRPRIGADQLAGANGVIVLTAAVTRDSVADAGELLAVGRFGVGYDSVDVRACTDADVLLFITVGAVDRPVAEATVGWMIALTHHMSMKDRLTREAKWDERSRYMGRELRDRTLGVIGLGGIARKLIELLAGWGMRPPIAYDPLIDPAVAQKLGVRVVELDEVLRTSDFVSIHCPLTEKTRGLIGKREIALLKPDAFLINTARGGIVDEDALYDALQQQRIAGAALDCFATEPQFEPSRFRDFDNVLLAPHSIAWTNEMFRDIGRAACQGMIDLSQKRRPRGIVNPEVLERPGFRRKWERICGE